MPINISRTEGVSAAQAGNIGIQDFLKILTEQLNNQDPLKPVDNEDFVAQIAQFTSLEQSRQLNAKIDQLLAGEAANQSIGLLGRNVEALVNGRSIIGVVTAIGLKSGEPLLTITTSSGFPEGNINLSQLVNILKNN